MYRKVIHDYIWTIFFITSNFIFKKQYGNYPFNYFYILFIIIFLIYTNTDYIKEGKHVWTNFVYIYTYIYMFIYENFFPGCLKTEIYQ